MLLPEVMKRIVIIAILICVVLVPSCSQPIGESEPSTIPGGTSPAPPIEVDLSFPNGAPALNETAEVQCTIKIHHYTTDLEVEINLPDAFELVSGELLWAGDIAMGDEAEVIKAVIKSVKVGNWSIEALVSIGSESGWYYYDGIGKYPVYVSVSEGSAEWGEYPPWTKRAGFPVPPVRSVEAPSSP